MWRRSDGVTVMTVCVEEEAHREDVPPVQPALDSEMQHAGCKGKIAYIYRELQQARCTRYHATAKKQQAAGNRQQQTGNK